MSSNNSAAKVVGSIAAAPTRFFLQKKAISPMLNAIRGGQQHQHAPPVKGLQDRDDASGKYARKVGQNRRALALIADAMQDEQQELIRKHAAVYPEIEIVDGVERPHPEAGKPTPVYQMAQDGVTPIFKKDRAGNDTTERVVMPDQYNLADPMAFQRDMKEMMDEWVMVECPGFTEEETIAFKGIAPRIVDPLLDIEVGGPTNATPEDQAAAYRATAKIYLALADKIGSPSRVAEPTAEPTADPEERTAP